MAQDPKITLNVDTSAAVKNLLGLEETATDSDQAIEKIDGSSVSVDTSATQRALQEVADKLDKVDANSTKAGKQGIPVSTNAFKDLTEGIGGPASGAIGSLFGFGETLEGLGDLAEGFGTKLGLTETQVGNLTTKLGTGLAALGLLGVGFTLAQAANEAWGNQAEKEAKKQEELNKAIDNTAESLRNVAEAFREGDKAKAFRGIVEDLTPLLDNMKDAGIDAADAVLDIATGSTRTEDKLRAMGQELIRNKDKTDDLSATDVDYLKNIELVITEVEKRRLGIERATEQDQIAETALGRLNTTVEDNTELLEKNATTLEERRQKQLDAIETERDLELQFLNTKDAIEGYDEKIAAARGDTDKMRQITLETAGEVVNMAKAYGALAGPEGSIENVKATREALTFLSGDLEPGSPLRTNILGTIADLAKIETGFVSGGPITGRALSAKEGGVNTNYNSNTTINVTVTSADPQAVVKALQTYVRQNGSLPANLR